MPLVDLPLAKLREYRPELTAEKDFDSFWQRQLEVSRTFPLNARLQEVEYPVSSVKVYDLVYDGADGTPVHGWYVVPAEAQGPLPVIVRYHGYSGNRGRPNELLHWASMGLAALAIDTRGQGGLTPDLARYPEGSAVGWMSLGIADPNTYYYKQVYIDCVRALDFVCARPEIDVSRIAVYGGSQGGGLTLAVAGIDDRPKVAMPVYPFLCDFRRSVEIHSTGPYPEIKNWFRRFDPEHLQEEQVYRTLSYFDGMNFAPRIKARTLMAITLQDTTCPPSTCFAAYNHLAAEKELKIYHDYGHEGLPFHEEAMMWFVHQHL
ncbi:acetylxylan esterase [Paenibacillus hamazuiensis]|uniref:acetylxylan esterase n=1 Tax=Paenibacillus hamazuiensis TaxID=2936508 RepID=UPI002010B3E9|nr:acetylxylan esterase [Paenibacillus hamazuiensis]